MHSQSSKTEEQNLVIEECSQLFDLNDREQLLVFSNWLAKLEAIEHLAFFLPASKAKVDEDLFKLRMAALAKLGDIGTHWPRNQRCSNYSINLETCG